MRLTLFAAALLMSATAAAANPVAVTVNIPVPPQMSRDQLVKLFDASQPQFRVLPGLIRKYYSIGDDNRAGGLYLFTSRAAAEAQFTEAWKAGVLKRWGSPAAIAYYDVPIVLDGPDAGAR